MKLTTMTMNALRALAEARGEWKPNSKEEWEAGPPKELIAAMPYEHVKAAYSIGKLGLADIVKWLAADGLAMQSQPAATKRNQVTQARIDEAIELLCRHGYRVRLPDSN